jgi:26S proteasome regulatory subunit T1
MEQANATDVGIIDEALSPVEMILMCGSFVTELGEATLGATARPLPSSSTMRQIPPSRAFVSLPPATLPLILLLFIYGPKLIRFVQNSYVPAQMEYILTEMLMNSFRVTVEH